MKNAIFSFLGYSLIRTDILITMEEILVADRNLIAAQKDYQAILIEQTNLLRNHIDWLKEVPSHKQES